MSAERLGQSDFEDLSAFVDGELPDDTARRVERLVVDDPAWREARRQLQAVDEMLDLWRAPAPPADLARRISRQVRLSGHRSPVWVRVVRIAAPLAAAAAVLLAVMLTRAPQTSQPEGRNVAVQAQPLPKVPAGDSLVADALAADNLDFFQDYDVLSDYETLEALDRLERGGTL